MVPLSPGFPGGSAVKNMEPRKLGFHPRVGKIPWRRTWQPTPAFFPRESHGQRSLVGYSPQDCKEPNTPEELSTCAPSALKGVEWFLLAWWPILYHAWSLLHRCRWVPWQVTVSPYFSAPFDIFESFADIDECLQDPSRCGPNSVCTNTLGSYSCGCIVGFHPNPEDSWKHGNFSCQSNNLLTYLGNRICVFLCRILTFSHSLDSPLFFFFTLST